MPAGAPADDTQLWCVRETRKKRHAPPQRPVDAEEPLRGRGARAPGRGGGRARQSGATREGAGAGRAIRDVAGSGRAPRVEIRGPVLGGAGFNGLRWGLKA